MWTIFHKKVFPPLFLLLFLLAGCKIKKPLPFYQLEVGEKTVLTVDGIRYISDTDVIQLHLYRPGCWRFTGEIGSAVGVCGGDNPERGGGFDICRITGDEEQCFLYVLPNHFVFGPYYTYFFAQEDLQLTPPSAETVSDTCIDVTIEDNVIELSDTDLITALLDFYFENTEAASPHTSEDKNMTAFTLTLYHRNYPFLTAEIKGSQYTETGASFLTCLDGVRRELPAELAEQLSEAYTLQGKRMRDFRRDN